MICLAFGVKKGITLTFPHEINTSARVHKSTCRRLMLLESLASHRDCAVLPPNCFVSSCRLFGKQRKGLLACLPSRVLGEQMRGNIPTPTTANQWAE